MTVALLHTRPAPLPWLGTDESEGRGGRLFEEQLRAEFQRTASANRPCSLLVLEPKDDCDSFLDVLVGLALVEGGRDAGAFALGNGRFALLLPGSSLDVALSLARIVQLRLRFLSDGRARVLIGAAATDADADADAGSPEELFARADLAMNEAEANGEDRPVAFGESYSARSFRPACALPPRLLAELAHASRLTDVSQQS